MQQTTIRQPIGLLSAALIGVSALYGQAWAANGLSNDSSQAYASAQSGYGAGQQSSDSSTGFGDASASNGPITSSSSANGSMSYALLSGSASASVGTDTPSAENKPEISGSAYGNSAMRLIDTITITSATLADGEAVSVEFELFLDSAVAASGQYVSAVSAQSFLALWDAGHGYDLANGYYPSDYQQLANYSSTYSDTSSNGLTSIKLIYNTTVGASFDVSLALGLYAAADFYQTGDGKTGSSSNASGSAWFTIATGPDFSYLAASGHEYNGALPPVPEPETYAMLLAGLGLVGFAARRRLSGGTLA